MAYLAYIHAKLYIFFNFWYFSDVPWVNILTRSPKRIGILSALVYCPVLTTLTDTRHWYQNIGRDAITLSPLVSIILIDEMGSGFSNQNLPFLSLKMVLIGAPGAGKSSVFRRITANQVSLESYFTISLD